MKLIVLLVLLPFCCGNLCPKGEYRSTISWSCLKCAQCKPHEIVVRTCQSHRNTKCSSTSSKTINKNVDSNLNDDNKRDHHFERGKLHYFSDKDTEDLLENNLIYPSSLVLKVKDNMNSKHKSTNQHYNANRKQRINDKFLKWDDDDKLYDEDYYNKDDLSDDFELKKYKKHFEHKSLKKNHHHNFKKGHQLLHHSTVLSDSLEYDDDNLDTVLNKHSKPTASSNKVKWKDINHKEAARLAQLEDEKKLEEWLLQSKKQFKDRKDNLLKTLKEEQTYESDKRIRLNYPLLNANNRFSDTFKYSSKNDNENKKTQKKHMDSEVELFKELIKNEESQEMELATLMSNKKDQPFHYRNMVTPSHRMFLGEPSSDIRAMNGNVKDPQEVIKEEMGRNIIFEKSKFTIVPLIKHSRAEMLAPMPFTAAERLVWDWQAIAIVSAVAACILFFLVISIFILLNARHWRKEKCTYNPECEEMSTRVALIQPSLEASAAEGNNTNRFLQQFLSLNDNTVKEKTSIKELHNS